MAVWKLNVKEIEAEFSIELVYKWKHDSPVKCACLMSDGSHVCTGAFDGSVSMWNIQVNILYHLLIRYLTYPIFCRHFDKL